MYDDCFAAYFRMLATGDVQDALDEFNVTLEDFFEFIDDNFEGGDGLNFVESLGLYSEFAEWSLT